MITPTRERRDWTLLVFVIPIGIILMLIAGQIAIRFVPEWNVNADMQSNLDPNTLPNQKNAPVQPILPAILTPLGWLDTFLTPGAGSGDEVLFPPFVIFEPSATPEVTLPPPTVSTQPSPTVPTPTAPTVIVTPPPTGTKPPDEGEETPPRLPLNPPSYHLRLRQQVRPLTRLPDLCMFPPRPTLELMFHLMEALLDSPAYPLAHIL